MVLLIFQFVFYLSHVFHIYIEGNWKTPGKFLVGYKKIKFMNLLLLEFVVTARLSWMET